MDIPYLSKLQFQDTIYIGIIGNYDSELTSIYCLSEILNPEERKLFLKIGEEWWWETNRGLPINIAMPSWKVFKPYLKTFSSKEIEILEGPIISLETAIKKTTKRKQINLMRKPKK